MSWLVEFYQTASGRRPAEEWLNRQSRHVQARFARVARLLEERGLDVGRPHVAPVRGGVWEMRAAGTDRRLLYVAAQGSRFVILHGLAKGGKEVPERDIRIAIARGRDWRTRSDGR